MNSTKGLRIEVIVNDNHHQFLLLNRNSGTDIKNPMIWNELTLIAEPWLGWVRLASDVIANAEDPQYRYHIMRNSSGDIDWGESFKVVDTYE